MIRPTVIAIHNLLKCFEIPGKECLLETVLGKLSAVTYTYALYVQSISTS